jgi:hypothetical protein
VHTIRAIARALTFLLALDRGAVVFMYPETLPSAPPSVKYIAGASGNCPAPPSP